MGLDNSIVVRTTLSNGNTYEQDICYWRNKWKIRDKILDILKPKEETFEYIINKGDVKIMTTVVIFMTMDRILWALLRLVILMQRVFIRLLRS